MIIELQPGRIAVDPNNVVAFTVEGGYDNKRLIVEMSSGQKFVISRGDNNPDFSAEKTYRELVQAKTESLTVASPLTSEDLTALEWAIEQAEAWTGGIPGKDGRREHAESVGEARDALSKLQGDAE